MDNSILEQQALSLDALVNMLAIKVADKVLASIKPLIAEQQQKPLTREELIKQLDISPATLWKWERAGQIQCAFTIGRRKYYYLPK